MLRVASGKAPPVEVLDDRLDETVAGSAVWLDLLRPAEAEHSLVERVTGLRVPAQSEIAEIENSSRLVDEGGILYLSTPMVSRGHSDRLAVAPLGFVLSPDRLITVRFADSLVFDAFADHWRCDIEGMNGHASAVQPFLGLLEALVDRLADVLEHMGAALDTLSSSVFETESAAAQSSRRRDAFLRATLSDIGRRGELISQLRDGLLGVARIVRFVRETAASWLLESEARRLKVLERDIASLNDYDAQLTNKIQFLLDATLGFVNIEQNNGIKLLTVVSIVGIPPTFIASMYGMNFKNMPELNWEWGYQYALGLIALSVAVPLLLFWRKGWL